MKKLILLATACFTLGLTFGVTGVSQAVVVECYDAVNSCNDIKVIYTDGNINQGVGITHVFGREYGCGHVDRGFTGIIKNTTTEKHIIVTGHWNPTTQAQVGAIHINLNNATKTSGPGQYTYISGAVNPATTIHGTQTFTKVACPASSISSIEEEEEEEAQTPGRDVTLGSKR